jgi:hypothetical protein
MDDIQRTKSLVAGIARAKHLYALGMAIAAL